MPVDGFPIGADDHAAHSVGFGMLDAPLQVVLHDRDGYALAEVLAVGIVLDPLLALRSLPDPGIVREGGVVIVGSVLQRESDRGRQRLHCPRDFLMGGCVEHEIAHDESFARFGNLLVHRHDHVPVPLGARLLCTQRTGAMVVADGCLALAGRCRGDDSGHFGVEGEQLAVLEGDVLQQERLAGTDRTVLAQVRVKFVQEVKVVDLFVLDIDIQVAISRLVQDSAEVEPPPVRLIASCWIETVHGPIDPVISFREVGIGAALRIAAKIASRKEQLVDKIVAMETDSGHVVLDGDVHHLHDLVEVPRRGAMHFYQPGGESHAHVHASFLQFCPVSLRNEGLVVPRLRTSPGRMVTA